MALFLPFRAVRLDLLCEETGNLFAQREMLFGQVDGFHAGVRSVCVHGYILNTPKRVSSMGALSDAEMPSPRTMRVSAGSMTPSSHKRALA